MAHRLKDLCWRIVFVYSVLYICTLSFTYFLLPDPTDWIGEVLHAAARFTGDLFFGVNLRGATGFYSDSLPMYIHLSNMLLLAIIVGAIWTWKSGKRFAATLFFPLLLTILRFFLALMLFEYGFSKLYKTQFYLPEPNTLYRTVGSTPRDLLYWTSMGTSHTYSVFMALIEIIPAVLLLFRRTTLAGALIAFLVLINALFVNLGFDITVKLHSFTLLMMSLTLLLPARRRIAAFLSGQAFSAWNYPSLTWTRYQWLRPVLKAAIVVLFFLDANWYMLSTGTWNDDYAERPPMHGAYEVIATDTLRGPYTATQRHGGDSLRSPRDADTLRGSYTATQRHGADSPLSPIDAEPLHRVYIHRRGYIIFQNADGTWIDYPVVVDTSERVFRVNVRDVVRYEQINDSTYYFTDETIGKTYTMKKLDWRKLPLLEEEFTWIDGK